MKFKILFFIFGLIYIYCYGQDCSDFQKSDNCKIGTIYNYTIYLQHENAEIGIHDTLTYNVAFTGNRDYVISFCTNKIYYPINIRLLEPGTGKVLYSNASEDYEESVVITLYNSRNLILKANLLSKKLDKNMTNNKEKICVGMDMQWKKLFSDSE